MNINIARFILALVAATAVGHGARAEAPPWPQDTHQAADSDISGPVFAASFSGSPFDVLGPTSRGPEGQMTESEAPIAHRSLLESGGGVTLQANGHSGDFAPLTGGVWLFLGGIWIIGTLVHHRQVIRKR